MNVWEIKMMLMVAALAICLVMLVISHVVETREAEELKRMEAEELEDERLRAQALRVADFFAGNVLR